MIEGSGQKKMQPIPASSRAPTVSWLTALSKPTNRIIKSDLAPSRANSHMASLILSDPPSIASPRQHGIKFGQGVLEVLESNFDLKATERPALAKLLDHCR